MNSFLIALAIVLALLLAWRIVRLSRRRDKVDVNLASNGDTVTGWTPQATRVLSNAERLAFETLRVAFPGHIVLAQVPLHRFLKVPTRNSYAEWLRRAGNLCADLVVCDRNSLVVAIVELQAAPPLTRRARRRHERMTRVLEAAGIPVHVWSEKALPDATAARNAITPAAAGTQPVTTPAESRPKAAATVSPVPPISNPFRTEWRDTSADDAEELRQAPPSTWFDDMETEPAPLSHNEPRKSDQGKFSDETKDGAK